MKKFFGSLVLVLMLALVLVGCAPTEKYAEKINDRAKDEKFLTYKQVKAHLGKEDGKVNGLLESYTCTWYKGAKDAEDAAEKVKAGKTVYVLTVTFNGNDNAKLATWTEWSK